jgi:plasmid stabilization system protein ParE
MASVIWSTSALTDLDRLYNFLTEIDPELSAKAIQAIVEFGGSLSKNPRRGTPIVDTPGLRKILVPFGKSSYMIHYIILDEEILILRVYHGRQDRPG